VTRTRRYVVSLVVVVVLAATALVGVLLFDVRPKLGLDLQGGLSVVLTAKGEADAEVLEQTVEIIRNRVDSLGAQEPDISTSGTENIIVQLPGIRDQRRALEIIGQTAQLRFREVLDAIDVSTVEAEALEGGERRRGTDEFNDFVNDRLREGGWAITPGDPVEDPVVFQDAVTKVRYRLGPAEVIGRDIDDAMAIFDQARGTWTVDLTMTGEGTDKWADVTTRLAGEQKQLAIVLDRRVESAPAVQQPITDGKAQISGQFSERDAKDLALVLRTGALPIELERSQVQQVSATLGTASLRSGLIAGAIGISLVAVYMFAFYRALGVINLIGLAFFSCIILGIIGLIGVTQGFALTLAGVAGLIVSVGIAADSYIIYFERVKDELKEGKTFRSAVDRAFRSALRTNIAANGVAFLAAIILYLVAVGPVRGFALTLGMSVIVDVALLYFFTHPAVALLARSKRFGVMKGIGIEKAIAPAEPVTAS
jgi:preprotein translocase subunit SecD